jgi:hypothetical protein
MVKTRKEKNSYVQSEDQKEKLRNSVKSVYASREVFSPELRKKFSETMKRSWEEGKIDTANHWSKTESGKARIAASLKGFLHNDASRRNMSISAQKRLRTKRDVMYTSAKGGLREDLGQYFRSAWEANFARILTYQGKVWEYESKTFQLSESFSYTPDFYCDGTFFEVKGRMDEKAEKQLRLMAEVFPDVKIEVVDYKVYSLLRDQFKKLISPFWEGK